MRLALLIALGMPLVAQQRIVSTSPGITETLFALGLGDRVVGVSNYCRHPASVNSRTRVGSWLQPNIEVITALKPDLVLMQRLPTNRAPEQLRRLKVRVVEIEHGSLEDTLTAWETIASAAGAPGRGRDLADRTRKSLDLIRAKTTPFSKQSLVFIVGRTPARLEGMFAVGRGGFLNELMTVAGGQNIFADSPLEYPKITLETITSLSPAVIIDMGDMAETTGVTEERKTAVVNLWKRALPSKRVFAVASDIYVVPGPRIVDAANAFAAMLHPEFHR